MRLELEGAMLGREGAMLATLGAHSLTTKGIERIWSSPSAAGTTASRFIIGGSAAVDVILELVLLPGTVRAVFALADPLRFSHSSRVEPTPGRET
jgi:hypothetical protein